MSAAQHHEAKVSHMGGISLATRALALHTATGLTEGQIAIRLFGEDTVGFRREVTALLDQARRDVARAN